MRTKFGSTGEELWTSVDSVNSECALMQSEIPFGANIFEIQGHLQMSHRIYSFCHIFLMYI